MCVIVKNYFKMNKKKWLNSPIDNIDLYGFSKKDINNLPKKLRNKSPNYLNSNKYQVDELYNQLLKCSQENQQYYAKYEFDIIKQCENFKTCPKSLFNKDMLKDFVDFCYDNK